MHRIGDQVAQRYSNTARGNGIAPKRKIDSDGFAVPVMQKRQLVANRGYRPVATTVPASRSEQQSRPDVPSRSSQNDDDEEDMFDDDDGRETKSEIDDAPSSPSMFRRVAGTSLSRQDDESLRLQREQQRLLEELEDDRRQYLLSIDTAAIAAETPPPTRWPNVTDFGGKPSTSVSETVSSDDAAVVPEAVDDGVNWADVMNSYARNMQKERQDSAWYLRPVVISDDCVDIGDSYARACWSLISHLDDDMCAMAFGVNDSDKSRLTATLSKIREHLRSIRRCASYNGVDPQFVMSPRDETEEIDVDDSSSDPARWSRDKWMSVASDDPERSARSLVQLVMLLDYELRKLCRLPCAGSMMRENLDARSINFASVNAPFSEEHAKYMKLRMECTGYYDAKVNGKTNARMGLKGSFLVSLRNSDQSSQKNSKLNYPTWADLDGSLNRIVEEFSREFMDIRPSVRVFLNVSMRKDTRHYRVLRSSAPSDGVLALLDLAHATYDPSRRIVSVRAYVTCTMSSTNSPPK